MKVLLVIPRKKSPSILPAPDIGLAYVARAALNEGAEVTVLDAHREQLDERQVGERVSAGSFDLIGIKTLSVDIYTALAYCMAAKRARKNTATLLGGYHPTALPRDVMRHSDVDYLIRGEGEPGMRQLIRELRSSPGALSAEGCARVPGLVYRGPNGDIRINPTAYETDLDALGFPAWELFDLAKYPTLPGPGGRFIPVITSRGCPSRCTFCCSESMHGLRVRARSVPSVIEEISWLTSDFKPERVSIFDDNFTFYPDHALEFCAAFKEKRFPVKLDVPQGVRLDRITPDVARALSGAGCDYVGVGVESGDQGTLDAVQKGTTLALIREKISLMRKNGNFRIMGFFVIGFPHEGEAEIKKTIDFSLALALDYATFTIFTPFPGTALFEQMAREGYFSVDSFNWEDLLLDKPVFKHRLLTQSRLKGLQRQAYLRFYVRPSKAAFFRRILFEEKSAMSYIKRFMSIVRS